MSLFSGLLVVWGEKEKGCLQKRFSAYMYKQCAHLYLLVRIIGVFIVEKKLRTPLASTLVQVP